MRILCSAIAGVNHAMMISVANAMTGLTKCGKRSMHLVRVSCSEGEGGKETLTQSPLISFSVFSSPDVMPLPFSELSFCSFDNAVSVPLATSNVCTNIYAMSSLIVFAKLFVSPKLV